MPYLHCDAPPFCASCLSAILAGRSGAAIVRGERLGRKLRARAPRPLPPWTGAREAATDAVRDLFGETSADQERDELVRLCEEAARLSYESG